MTILTTRASTSIGFSDTLSILVYYFFTPLPPTNLVLYQTT